MMSHEERALIKQLVEKANQLERRLGIQETIEQSTIAHTIHSATSKATPVDADELGLADSAASFVLKKLTWANLKATLLTYFTTLFVLLAGKAGGQSVSGGTAASETLTLQGTSHATPGNIILNPSGGGIDYIPAVTAQLKLGGLNITEGATTFYTGFSVNGATGAVTFTVIRATAAAALMGAAVTGDTFRRFITSADGTLSWGPGSATRDTTLVRSGVGLLTASGSFGVGGVTPAAPLDVLQITLGSIVQRLASTATNDDPTEDFIQDRVATTDATVTTLHSFTIPASTTQGFSVRVVARRTGGASGTAEDGAFYDIICSVKNVAGTATLIGTVTVTAKEDQAAWDATVDVTGATARVRVTGAASNNVTWHMHARVYSVST